MQKLYCYVDETGQDTQGNLFIVSVVITEDERDNLAKQLEQIEKFTGKGRRKWMKTRGEQQVSYIRSVLAVPALKGCLSYALYRDTTNYVQRTILTTARAITTQAKEDYKATVFVDGLQKSQVPWFGKELRHLHIRTQKVRGVRKEEADTLMRLADALSGFVRAALSSNEEFKMLLEKSKQEGFVREL